MAPGNSAGEVIAIDFETLPAGQPPLGYSFAVTGSDAQAVWIVEEQSDAPSGRHVLLQTVDTLPRAAFPLAVHDGISAVDIELSVAFMPLSGQIDQAAGLVWRFQDEDNYYIVRANALEGNVVAYKVQNGQRVDLPLVGRGRTYGVDASVPSKSWSTLGVIAMGDRFVVSLNGTELFEVEDSTFTEAGKIGLWTKADSVTAFDDLTVTAFK